MDIKGNFLSAIIQKTNVAQSFSPAGDPCSEANPFFQKVHVSPGSGKSLPDPSGR